MVKQVFDTGTNIKGKRPDLLAKPCFLSMKVKPSDWSENNHEDK